MFAFIQGILKEKEPHAAIIETNGIGYRISIPLNAYSQLPLLESQTFLYLSQVIREDSHTLYGFLSKEERDLFETLITISGIGPKTAVAIIGHMETQALHHAIQTSDLRILSKIPGIGKKTAERLVIELRDKLKGSSKKDKHLPATGASQGIVADAINALLNLGYNALEAQKAVKTAMNEKNDETDLGSLISLALRKM